MGRLKHWHKRVEGLEGQEILYGELGSCDDAESLGEMEIIWFLLARAWLHRHVILRIHLLLEPAAWKPVYNSP
jgi:hypothetical protein